jgi:hypothetical protein
MRRFFVFIFFNVSRSCFIRNEGASSQSFDNESSDRFSYIPIFNRNPCFWNCGKDAAVGVDSARINEDCKESSQDVDAGYDEDVGEPTALVGLVDGIRGGQDE